MILRASLLVLCLSASFSADAAPRKKAAEDQAFQVFKYSESGKNLNVIKTKVGKFSEIQFSEEEGRDKIYWGMGDKDAWTIKQDKNVLMMKPKAAFADTNLKIKTNKGRVYWFKVTMAKSDDEVLWHADFEYPDEPVFVEPVTPAITPEMQAVIAANKAAQAAQAEKQLIEERFGFGKDKSAATTELPVADQHIVNGDYGFIGPGELMPTSVYDNGEQTAMTFAPNNPVPTVFFKEADGSESRVAFHFENDMLIVHRVARKLILRRGDAVGCVINGSFNASGSNVKTHTVSDDVIREVKGE